MGLKKYLKTIIDDPVSNVYKISCLNDMEKSRYDFYKVDK